MSNRQIQKISKRIGALPTGWTVAPLSKVVRIANGQVDPKETRYRDLPHVGPENIESGTGRIQGVKTSKELALKSGKYLFDADAIVYSKIRPNLNKVCRPRVTGLCSADAYPMWPVNGMSPDFLCYYMLSELFVKQSVACSMRTGMPKINREDLNAVWVICPGKQEQVAISLTIAKWDRAIDLSEKLIAEKRLWRKGLMQQLLTGKRRLPGFDGKWKEVCLGDIFHNRIDSGQNELPLVAITTDRGVIPRDEVDRKDSSSDNKSKYLRICPGDIGYNTMRMWQGVSGLSALEGIVSPAYTIVTPKKGVDAEFMAILFTFQPVVHLFYRFSQGMVSDTWNLKFLHFAEIKVTIPYEAEQKAIARVFCGIDHELELLQAKADALREQKKGLMQQLLTGKIRVKV